MSRRPRIRIARVVGQGWALYDADGELVGVSTTKARARRAAAREVRRVIVESEPGKPSATDDGS